MHSRMDEIWMKSDDGSTGSTSGTPVAYARPWVAVAAEVEFLAGVYLHLLPLGERARIDPDEMRAVIEGLRSYRSRVERSGGVPGGERSLWPFTESRFQERCP